MSLAIFTGTQRRVDDDLNWKAAKLWDTLDSCKHKVRSCTNLTGQDFEPIPGSLDKVNRDELRRPLLRATVVFKVNCRLYKA